MGYESKNIAILASFACLWLVSFMTVDLELILGFLLILSFGMLHGANDILLFAKISNSKKTLSYGLMLALYLGTVLLVLFIFYWAPILALIIFVGSSAYHFGEQHWQKESLNSSLLIKKTFYFIYGLYIILLLLFLNQAQVAPIIESIVNEALPSLLINYLFYGIGISLVILIVYLGIKDVNFRRRLWQELLYLSVFAVIFNVSSLIWGFAIYFIFWHSLPSLYDQIRFMYNGFDKFKMFDYFKKAAPYWLISVIGLIAIYLVFKDIIIFNALFFSFLAAVTLPHSFLISRMFKQTKTE